jgi:hypothetical protein
VPPENQFYGERDAFIADPFGHGWTIAAHVADVSQQEMAQRLAALFKQLRSADMTVMSATANLIAFPYGKWA